MKNESHRVDKMTLGLVVFIVVSIGLVILTSYAKYIYAADFQILA